MKRSLLIILSILCLILCLGLASCGGNGGTETGTETGTGEESVLDSDQNSGLTTDSDIEQGGGLTPDPEKEYITITFDTKGGSTLDSIQVKNGSKITKPTDPIKEGYTLEDWYYGEEKWSFGDHMATEDMTLEASWTPVTYTIEYVGATGEKVTYTIEDEFDLFGECEEYYILGWYLDKKFTKPISKIERGTVGNLKLYGKKEYCGVKFELKQDEYAVVDCDENATGIIIPETYKGLRVTLIDEGAFYNCTELTSVTIPNSVTTIGDRAFEGCTYIASIEIPNSVVSIGKETFYGCKDLTSVTIPNSVTTIGNDAFEGCSSIARVDISDIGAWCDISFSGFFANPLYYGENLYLNGELVTDLVIPNGIITIGNYAFRNCTALTSIEIPNSVTSIGDSTFFGCEGLTSIEIPNSVTSIGNATFSGCKGLTSVTIGNGVISIDGFAFSGCKELTSVVIPNSVTVVGDSAFYGCSKLTIYCEAESQPSGWDPYWNMLNKFIDIYCPVVWGSKRA